MYFVSFVVKNLPTVPDVSAYPTPTEPAAPRSIPASRQTFAEKRLLLPVTTVALLVTGLVVPDAISEVVVPPA